MGAERVGKLAVAYSKSRGQSNQVAESRWLGREQSGGHKGRGMSSKEKHLDYIQGAINRMASNLFFLKGWSITLVAGLFALAAKDTDRLYMLLAYYPLLIFWLLDGYFLSQERRFRSLYDHVRKLQEEVDFSMDTTPYKDALRNSWLGATLSRTLTIYYLGLTAVMLLIMFMLDLPRH